MTSSDAHCLDMVGQVMTIFLLEPLRRLLSYVLLCGRGGRRFSALRQVWNG
jgi:hypothetical protein